MTDTTKQNPAQENPPKPAEAPPKAEASAKSAYVVVSPVYREKVVVPVDTELQLTAKEADALGDAVELKSDREVRLKLEGKAAESKKGRKGK